jgi:hypothetical protein
MEWMEWSIFGYLGTQDSGGVKKAENSEEIVGHFSVEKSESRRCGCATRFRVEFCSSL